MTSEFVTAQWFATLTTVLLAVAVGVAAVGVLTGRLRWGLLSWLTVGGGAVLAIGSPVSQVLLKSAAESLSFYLQPAGADWYEPGFLAGIDFGGTLSGLVILLLGWAFRTGARFARDADGVV